MLGKSVKGHAVQKGWVGFFTLALPFCLSLMASSPVQATVLTASLNRTLIAFENAGASDVDISYQIDAISSVEITICRVDNAADPCSAENTVATIQQNGVGVGTWAYTWSAKWLIGGDLGRKNGDFRIIVSATAASQTPATTSFTISTLLKITSVDIHNVVVTPSFDANQSPVLPYIISYDLAKDSLVTIKVKDSSSNVVRTLLSNSAQFGETTTRNTLTWNGLDDNNKPTPLGVYTVELDATDAVSGDTADRRTRTASIISLASLGSSLNELFASNAVVYPNPIRNGQATIQALAVRNNANITMKIYTIAGDLVREEGFANVATGNEVNFTWDTTNKSGSKVGRGLYYVVVRQEDAEGTLQAVKKFAVMR